MATTPRDFADSTRHYLEAPAGHGKTELIVESLQHLDGTRQLILTHTHAGVRALRDRMRRKRIPLNAHRLETIAGFALRWAAGYPSTSGLDDVRPIDQEWQNVYPAATRVLENESLLDVVASTYDGLIVDEYQDCSRTQHRLVATLARVLPTRVLGDPLQGILGFNDDDPLVRRHEILEEFAELDSLDVPHRWRRTNPDLGFWLQDARSQLLAGEDLKWPEGIVDVRQSGNAAVLSALREYMGTNGSVVALRAVENQAHDLAKRTAARYTSMETVHCAALHRHARAIQSGEGPERAIAVLDFVEDCISNTRQITATARRHYAAGELPPITRGAPAQATAPLNRVAASSSLEPIWHAITTIAELADRRPFRRELFWEMKRSLDLAIDITIPLDEAAWRTRDRTRRIGRQLPRRLVSRTPLVKGLEFDHVVLIDFDSLNNQNRYVAITRPSTKLTVFL